MFLRCCLALATLTLCSAAAQADTFELDALFLPTNPFNLRFAIVTGPIIIDTTKGTVTAADLTLTSYDGKPTAPQGAEELAGPGFNIFQEAVTYSGSLGLPPTTFPSPTTYYQLQIADSGYVNNLLLNLPVASLVGYGGGTFCASRLDCPTYFGGIQSNLEYSFDGLSDNDNLENGTLTLETTAVPEPSTLTFISTGVIGLAGAFRRRRMAWARRRIAKTGSGEE